MAEDEKTFEPAEDVKKVDGWEGANSEDYTAEREAAGMEHFKDAQEASREQFVFLGEPEPEVDIPDPREREGLETFSERDREAYETQTDVALGDTPSNYHDFFDAQQNSPDINPEAKEFQVMEPDEHTGPEAADEASRTGVNPRSAATASDREGMEQPTTPDLMAPVSENAEPVTKARKPSPATPDVLDD